MKYRFIVTLISCILLNTVTAQVPTDCVDSVIVCGNSNINLDVGGIGVQELTGLNTCFSQENNSLWLQVTVINNGTLGFTLTPNINAITEDYDFFVFGPDVPCNNIGQAIRCSTTNPDNAGQGNNLTGMNGTESDISEGPGPNGNSFVSWLNVLAGETYFIVIDRPIGNSPFSLEWTGTAEFSDPPANDTGSSTALNLEESDALSPFADGFTEFNLTNNTNAIIGSQTDIVVTYYETESNANIGIFALSSPYINTSNPQDIFVRITNSITGCFEITQFELNVLIGFQKFFTPNNDSYNDRWQVFGTSNQLQPNTTIFIYDRYGKLLKQLDPTGPGWDGTFNGRRLPSNDYWFHVTLQDGRMFKNHFTLKR